MQDLNDKITGGTLTADEWNEVPSELQNIIEAVGIALSSGDLNQLGKGLASYSAVSTFYTCTGGTLAYIATKIGSFQAPASYNNGMIVRFRPNVNNTGATTINVNALGVKSVLSESGQVLTGGEFSTTRDVQLRYDGSDFFISDATATGALQSERGAISGLQMSNDVGDTDHDIQVTQGNCRDNIDSETIVIPVTLTKKIDSSWVAGDNVGGLPASLTLAADTWYHFFAIRKNNGLTDVGFDTSLVAANLLSSSGYNQFRRIGSVFTNSSLNIIGFTQLGDYFQWNTPIEDFEDINPGTSTQIKIINVPIDVPVVANINISITDDSGTFGDDPFLIAGSGNSTLPTPTRANKLLHAKQGTSSDSAPSTDGSVFNPITNTLAQFKYRIDASSINVIISVSTNGWIDDRGKSA